MMKTITPLHYNLMPQVSGQIWSVSAPPSVNNTLYIQAVDGMLATVRVMF